MSKETATEERDSLHTVMIVEDDVHIGAFLVEAITGETPYHALLVANGIEALETVKHLKPSLMILDYHLPGIDGLELYDRVHAMEMVRLDMVATASYFPDDG